MIRMIREMQDMGVGIIGFTGGEPLLREDLEEILERMDERSVSLVFSNGSGLTCERAKRLKAAGLLGIAVSMDSVDASEHDAKRGHTGAFREAVQAIRNAKGAGLYTMSQTVCTRELLEGEDLYSLARFLQELEVDEMRIIEPLPCGRLDSREEVLLTDGESQKLIQFHIECNRNKHLPKASVFPYFESDDQFGCGAGVQHSYIDPRGNLYPCDFVPVSCGNVFETPIKLLWAEMHKDMGAPRRRCFSKVHLSQLLKGKDSRRPVQVKPLPATGCECEGVKLPGFYRILEGDRT